MVGFVGKLPSTSHKVELWHVHLISSTAVVGTTDNLLAMLGLTFIRSNASSFSASHPIPRTPLERWLLKVRMNLRSSLVSSGNPKGTWSQYGKVGF